MVCCEIELRAHRQGTYLQYPNLSSFSSASETCHGTGPYRVFHRSGEVV